MARGYRMTARAEAAAETARRIVDVAKRLFLQRDYDDVTLQDVADGAGVSLQTVLRRFDSKERLANAVGEEMTPQIEASRAVQHPGDVGEAVRRVLASFEAMGEVNWRMLRQEHRIAILRELLQRGRASHRRWIEAAFAPHLPARGRARERMIVKLFAATDFYQWKLLRVDLGLPLGEVERTMREIVEAIVKERS